MAIHSSILAGESHRKRSLVGSPGVRSLGRRAGGSWCPSYWDGEARASPAAQGLTQQPGTLQCLSRVGSVTDAGIGFGM